LLSQNIQHFISRFQLVSYFVIGELSNHYDLIIYFFMVDG